MKTLLTFAGGTDGAIPASPPIFGTDGRIYGTTASGGKNNGGILYELDPGNIWRYKVSYSFPVAFAGPRDSLAFDTTGNLYGVTYSDHVFQLIKTSGKWTGKSIHKFSPLSREGDGFNVQGGVAVDDAGQVYGVTASGTAKNGWSGGVIYQFVPGNPKWAENILYAFKAAGDGRGPTGQVIWGPSGFLYGVTQSGGDEKCNNATCGTVFEFALN